MPFMEGGSCLEIMKAGFADGFEEVLVSTFLKESLMGLNHLHQHGRIHQDVKAGSILVDGNGRVQLADFGVSTSMLDTGDQQQSRSTFLGSCCWMAPEVIERVHGYDSKTDIWSFGITALELAHGVGPFSKYPMKVFFNSLQHGVSEMDCAFFKTFSKSFKNMVALCLAKDPSRRPSAEQLLQHPFFKQALTSEYIYQHVLDGLSPLSERVKNLKIIETAQLALKKNSISEEKISQREYVRGVHSWICNSHDLGKTDAVTIFKGGPADLAPQMDDDWEGSCLQSKNSNPIEYMDVLAERDAALMEKSTASAERLAAYAERDAAILQRDIATADRDTAILNRDAALSALARLEKKSSGRARRPSQTTLDDVMNGSKLLQRMDLSEHCTFAAEFRPDATPSTHSGIVVLDAEATHLQGVHRFGRDKESQIEIFVRTKRKATELADPPTHRGKHPRAAPKKGRNWPVTHQGQQLEPEREGQAVASNAEVPGAQAREPEVLNSRVFRSPSVPTPIPYCSCTGMNQQCYRWGNGGWQSACCTTLISMFPLPLNPKKRGSRVAGRKMSAGAFDKLLEKLVAEGVNINLPVDLREHWAKHGTNRYVTLR
ncbi:hypothetical protein KC19_4G077700 [Ceratodon purpureus]|nr:hypothetical protein KC19_4G077700 [Ceratodon purpureus]